MSYTYLRLIIWLGKFGCESFQVNEAVRIMNALRLYTFATKSHAIYFASNIL